MSHLLRTRTKTPLPVSSGLTVVEATLATGALLEAPASEAPRGRKWRVRVFEYGLSKNRYPYPENGTVQQTRLPLLWTERSARETVRHLEGARCFADHVAESAAGGAGHSVRDLVGFYSDPKLGGRGPEATLTLLESEAWARAKMLAAWHTGRTDLIGFSVDAVIGVRPVGAGGTPALAVEEMVALHSVDMVSAASSGGRALEVVEGEESEPRASASGQDLLPKSPRAWSFPEKFVIRNAGVRNETTSIGRFESGVRNSEAEAGNQESGDRRKTLPPSLLTSDFWLLTSQKKGATMREAMERMLEALRSAAASSAAQGSSRAAGESWGSDPLRRLQEVLESELSRAEADPARVLAALADWLAGSNGREAGLAPEVASVREQVRDLQQQIGEATRRQSLAESRLLLDSKLAASRLPKPLANLVASRFRAGGAFGEREFNEETIDMEIQNVREAYAAVSPAGRVLETGRVRVLREPGDKMQMGLDRLFGLRVEDSGVPAFQGIREAYVAYTGDPEISGLVSNRLRVREDFTTAGFPNALGNTLRRLLLRDYAEKDYGINLIAQFSSVPDFRTQERVRVGYFGDLPTVNTEAADYGELTAPTDEKATYSVVTFGGVVTVTRKMIINDDLGVVPQIVLRLGRAARRTLAQRVFNLMINNAAIYDSVAWFHATHGNLGSTALSAAELDVVRVAMRNRTEKDSGKKLGIAPNVLVVPNELEGLARKENEREYVDASFTPNPVRHLFGPSGERIIVSPLLTDTNDWYVFANVNEAPTVEVGFLQGRQEPEFFLADNPNAEAVFTSDKIKYKVRHEHEAVVIDYRGAYKEVVA